LSAEFGLGFDGKSLRHMLKFAEAFSEESLAISTARSRLDRQVDDKDETA
jgi:hypothetical protein